MYKSTSLPVPRATKVENIKIKNKGNTFKDTHQLFQVFWWVNNQALLIIIKLIKDQYNGLKLMITSELKP